MRLTIPAALTAEIRHRGAAKENVIAASSGEKPLYPPAIHVEIRESIRTIAVHEESR